MGKFKVIVLAGTAGTGKSTIAGELLHEFKDTYPDLKFIEGDDLHPPANVEKMSRGIPLNDDDRDVYKRQGIPVYPCLGGL